MIFYPTTAIRYFHNSLKVSLLLILSVAPAISHASWSERVDLDYKLSTVASVTTLDLEDNAFVESFPINDFTELSNDEYRIELRPELSARLGDCDMSLKPRFRAQFFEDMGPLDGENETDLFINTASVNCQLGQGFEFSLGRQKYLWGNSLVRSPSNPFFPESVLFNPTDEVTGKDFAILTYRPNFNWEFSGVLNWDQSHIDEVPNPSSNFLNTNALKFEYLGDNYQAGLIVSEREGREPRIGGFGNVTMNDSLILYGEFTSSKDVVGLLPSRDTNGQLNRFFVADQVEDKTRSTFLLGGSYTFKNDWTGYLEYLHTNGGFNDDQAEEWLSLASTASTFLGTERMDEGVAILADAFDPLWRQTRRNYAVLQFNRTQLFNKSDIAFQYIHNLDDSSSSTSLSLTYALQNIGEIFFVASHNSGGGTRELGRIVNNAVQLGVRIYSF